jgi:hypothetical protein
MPIELLRHQGYAPTICWTNPNIQPVAEHDLRFETLAAWAAEQGIPVIVAGDDRAAWERTVAPAGFSREARCKRCYALRLEEAARVAHEQGFTHLATTLAVSPYQLFDACSQALSAACARWGLTPVMEDFRPYYVAAQEEARELGMYRQNYCGCRFSAAEAHVEQLERKHSRHAQ